MEHVNLNRLSLSCFRFHLFSRPMNLYKLAQIGHRTLLTAQTCTTLLPFGWAIKRPDRTNKRAKWPHNESWTAFLKVECWTFLNCVWSKLGHKNLFKEQLVTSMIFWWCHVSFFHHSILSCQSLDLLIIHFLQCFTCSRFCFKCLSSSRLQLQIQQSLCASLEALQCQGNLTLQKIPRAAVKCLPGKAEHLTGHCTDFVNWGFLVFNQRGFYTERGSTLMWNKKKFLIKLSSGENVSTEPPTCSYCPDGRQEWVDTSVLLLGETHI